MNPLPCTACGQPIIPVYLGGDLCKLCLRNALGIAVIAPHTPFTVTHNQFERLLSSEGRTKELALSGYALALFGTVEDRSLELPDGPWTELEDAGRPGQTLILRTWLIRAFHPDTRAYAELRWHPKRGERLSIGGLDGGWSDDDVKLARRAFDGFYLINRAGRKEGYRAMSPEVFVHLYPETYGRLLLERGRDGFTSADVAAELGISSASLYRYLRENHLEYPPA